MSRESVVIKDIPLDMVGSTVFGRYPKISLEQTFNMMVSDDWLVPFAGYKKVARIAPTGNGRALYYSSNYNHLIAVIGNGVYVIDNDYGYARIGTLDNSSGNVFIAGNDASQIAISAGGNIYIYNYSTSIFTKVTLDGWLPGYIAFQDGYFITVDTNSNQWRLSDFNNGLSWPEGSISAIATKPTRAVAAIPFPGKGNMLLVFGKTVVELWTDVGQQLFPYQRNTYININYGCLSPATIASENGIVVWLASNEQSGPVIMYTNGAEPIKISNDGIDFKLANLTAPQDSSAFLFRQDGHLFYQITFYTDNLTYAYDFNTQRFFTLTNEAMDYHIAKRVAYFNNNYVFVSFKDGNLYATSSLYADYDGHTIPRIRICKTITMPDSSPFVINKIEPKVEQGQSAGLQRIDMSFSIDGGQSFSNFVPRDYNPLAYRRNRMQWRGLGQSNEFIPQFRFYGNGRFVIGNGVTSIYQ